MVQFDIAGLQKAYARPDLTVENTIMHEAEESKVLLSLFRLTVLADYFIGSPDKIYARELRTLVQILKLRPFKISN